MWRRPDNDPATPTTVCPGEHVCATATGRLLGRLVGPACASISASKPAFGIRREVADHERRARGQSSPRAFATTSVAHAARSSDRQGLDARRCRCGRPPNGRRVDAIGAARCRLLPRLMSLSPLLQRGLFDEPPAPAPPQDTPQDAVTIVDARGANRPGGPRFGELVHAVLASAPLDADRAASTRLRRSTGDPASPADEIGGGGQPSSACWRTSSSSRARAADAGRVPPGNPGYLYALPDGTWSKASSILAFEEPAGWTVVDYKTDREIAAAGEERYRRQVALYAAAIAQATGRQAAGVLDLPAS